MRGRSGGVVVAYPPSMCGSYAMHLIANSGGRGCRLILPLWNFITRHWRVLAQPDRAQQEVNLMQDPFNSATRLNTLKLVSMFSELVYLGYKSSYLSRVGGNSVSYPPETM